MKVKNLVTLKMQITFFSVEQKDKKNRTLTENLCPNIITHVFYGHHDMSDNTIQYSYYA